MSNNLNTPTAALHSDALHPIAQKTLEYWFGTDELTPQYFETRNRLWFWGEKETDDTIRENFEADVIKAAKGEYDGWTKTPRGTLALIVLLDQFSLNLYREQPRSYDQSLIALKHAKQGLALKQDMKLNLAERVFFYLPFEHGENLIEQERSVQLFTKLKEDAPPNLKPTMEGYLDYAVRHHRVVKKYGRFPDRNEVYQRTSTPDELAFLDSPEAPF